jgi:hypothetical protein
MLTSQAGDGITVATYKYADVVVDGYVGATASYDKTTSGRGLADKGKNYTLGDSETANYDAAKFGIKVTNKQSGISAYVSSLWIPDSKAGDEAGILDAYLSWEKITNAGKFTVTGGKFLSYFGYESFYIPDMDQISYGLVSGIPGYHTGLKLDYTKDAFSAGIAVVDSLYSGDGFQQGDGKIGGVGIEVFVQYVFNDKFTLFGGIGYDGGNHDGVSVYFPEDGETYGYRTKNDFVLDIWGKYKVNSKLTLAGEITYTERELKHADESARAFSWLVFAKYNFTPDFSLVARVSAVYGDDGWAVINGSNYDSTRQYKFTLSPSYSFSKNFLIRTEFSWTHGDKGSFKASYDAKDNYFFGAQAVFQF